jgi:DNA alkylation repair enzyme.
LLESGFHEERLLALLMLVKKFEKGGDKMRKEIFNLYLANTKYINNWDLVDVTAPNIVGAYLEGKDCGILFELAKSKKFVGAAHRDAGGIPVHQKTAMPQWRSKSPKF